MTRGEPGGGRGSSRPGRKAAVFSAAEGGSGCVREGGSIGPVKSGEDMGRPPATGGGARTRMIVAAGRQGCQQSGTAHQPIAFGREGVDAVATGAAQDRWA